MRDGWDYVGADVGWKSLLSIQEGGIESATPVRDLYGKRIFLLRQNDDCAAPTPIPRRILTRLEQTNFKWWCPPSSVCARYSHCIIFLGGSCSKRPRHAAVSLPEWLRA